MSLSEVASEAPNAAQLQPSLPYTHSSLSYWHRTTRAFPYLNTNKTNPAPASAQYVIIGSGISGALTAFELLEAGVEPNEVLIIEAREAVSGSSGRNAGHVRPDACSGFGGYAAVHGAEQALKIVQDENVVLDRVTKFVQEHDIPCEFSLKQTFDVCLTQEIADDEARNVKQYVEAGGSMEHIKLYKGKEAAERTGVHNAISAWEWPAASIHPAKLAQWLLTNVVERGCKLWTHCPVTKVTQGKGTEWNVHTPRGIVSTQKIVHCTNVYAGFLLPQLSANLLTPIKVQVHSFVPTDAFTGERALQTTMALRYEAQRYYGLIQTKNDGMIIFAVAKPSGITFDESSYEKELVDEAVQQFGTLFPESKERKPRHGEGLDHAWSGLIAMTPDQVPYVGAIDELPGQYVCAGFNGHGMARIFTCAPGVVRLMLGGTWNDTKLPESFRYSQKRISGEK
jgi:glycine/D-amino acid oxidase-like deaminating enzyme